MDRASDYGSEGWGFESLRVRQSTVPGAGSLRACQSAMGIGRHGYGLLRLALLKRSILASKPKSFASHQKSSLKGGPGEQGRPAVGAFREVPKGPSEVVSVGSRKDAETADPRGTYCLNDLPTVRARAGQLVRAGSAGRGVSARAWAGMAGRHPLGSG